MPPVPRPGVLKTPGKVIRQYGSKNRVHFLTDEPGSPSSSEQRAPSRQPVRGHASSSTSSRSKLSQSIAEPVVHRTSSKGARFDPLDSSRSRRTRTEDSLYVYPRPYSIKLRRARIIEQGDSSDNSIVRRGEDATLLYSESDAAFQARMRRKLHTVDNKPSEVANASCTPAGAKGKRKNKKPPTAGTSASSQSASSHNTGRTAPKKTHPVLKSSTADDELAGYEPDRPDITAPLADSAPKNATTGVAAPAPKDVVMTGSARKVVVTTATSSAPKDVAMGVTGPKDVAMSVETSTPDPSQSPITSFFAQTRAATNVASSKTAPTPAPAPTPSLMSARPFSTPTADPDLVAPPLVSIRKTVSSMPPPITLPALPSALAAPTIAPPLAVPLLDAKIPTPAPAPAPAPQPASGFVLARPTGFGNSNPVTLPVPTSALGIAQPSVPQTQSQPAPAPHSALDSAFSNRPLNALQTTDGLDAPPPSISRISQQPAAAVPPTKPTGFAFTAAQNAPLHPLPQLAPDTQQPQVQQPNGGTTWLDQTLSLAARIAAIKPQPSVSPLAPLSTNVVLPKKPLSPPKERRELEAGDENASGSFYGLLDDVSRKKGHAKRKPLSVKTMLSPGSKVAAPKGGPKTEPKKVAKQTPPISPLNLSSRQRTAEWKPQPHVETPEDAEKTMRKSVSGHSKPGIEGHSYIKKLISDFSSMHPEMQPEMQPIVVPPPQAALARSQRQEAVPASPPRTGYSTSAVYLDESASCPPEAASAPSPSRGSKCPAPPTLDQARQPSSRRFQRIQSTSTLADEAFVRDFLADVPDLDCELELDLDLDLNHILGINAFAASMANADSAGAPAEAEAATSPLADVSSAVGFALGRTVAAVARLLA